MNGKPFLGLFWCLLAMGSVKSSVYRTQQSTTGKICLVNCKAVNIETFLFCSKSIILAWASGSGLSGLAAALSYAALSDIGFTPKFTLLLMLIIPLLQLVAFLLIKEPNNRDLFASSSESTTSLIDDSIDQSDSAGETSLLNISEKLRYSPKVLKYYAPLMFNFMCEYIINQGLVSACDSAKIKVYKPNTKVYPIQSIFDLQNL